MAWDLALKKKDDAEISVCICDVDNLNRPEHVAFS